MRDNQNFVQCKVFKGPQLVTPISLQSAKAQISAMLKAILFWSSFQPITDCAGYLKM